MQKILVPVDFSDNAVKAALFAAEIAKRNNATIYFLHSVEIGVDQIYPSLSTGKTEQNFTDARRADLERFRDGVTKTYGSIKTDILLEFGMPTDTILDACNDLPADVVVMGTRGAGKIKELLVGSVAAGVVSRTKIPVLVVPSDYKPEEPDGILFATSHFEKDDQLLSMIITLARIFSAKVYVVVFEDTDKAVAIDYLEDTRRLDEYLKFLTKKYPDIKFNGELAEGKHFENTIELYHVQHDTDIAAMITYRKGFWEKIFHKSVTKKMVYHSHIPVLVVPAR